MVLLGFVYLFFVGGNFVVFPSSFYLLQVSSNCLNPRSITPLFARYNNSGVIGQSDIMESKEQREEFNWKQKKSMASVQGRSPRWLGEEVTLTLNLWNLTIIFL